MQKDMDYIKNSLIILYETKKNRWRSKRSSNSLNFEVIDWIPQLLIPELAIYRVFISLLPTLGFFAALVLDSEIVLKATGWFFSWENFDHEKKSENITLHAVIIKITQNYLVSKYGEHTDYVHHIHIFTVTIFIRMEISEHYCWSERKK